MRTVSFASDRVHEMLNDDFVCHMINTEGDPAAGSSQAHAPDDPGGGCPEGLGNQNVQTLFLTPEGKIFHTVSGFCGPDTYLEELQFAHALFEEIQKAPEEAEAIVIASHRQRLKDEGLTDEALAPAARRRQSAADLLKAMQSSALRQSGRSFAAPDAFAMLQDMGGIFEKKQNRTKQLDYQFAVRYPMLPLEELEENPRLLVGNAVTAFSSGPASGGQIGGNSRPNAARSRSSAGSGQ